MTLEKNTAAGPAALSPCLPPTACFGTGQHPEAGKLPDHRRQPEHGNHYADRCQGRRAARQPDFFLIPDGVLAAPDPGPGHQIRAMSIPRRPAPFVEVPVRCFASPSMHRR